MDVLIRLILFVKMNASDVLIELERLIEGSEHKRSKKAGILMSEKERSSLKRGRGANRNEDQIE